MWETIEDEYENALFRRRVAGGWLYLYKEWNTFDERGGDTWMPSGRCAMTFVPWTEGQEDPDKDKP